MLESARASMSFELPNDAMSYRESISSWFDMSSGSFATRIPYASSKLRGSLLISGFLFRVAAADGSWWFVSAFFNFGHVVDDHARKFLQFVVGE